MTDFGVNPHPGEGEPAVSASAGFLLRAAREAAGLSVDAVAQQLKLATRQVQAIEDGDFKHLPGRTFVRGFVKNYARLVHLDPEAVVGALPAAVPTLESPALQPMPPSIGELPSVEHGKPGWTRWAIPMTLVAIIAAAALYESMRPVAEGRRGIGTRETSAASGRATMKSQAPEVIGTPLPNPIATAPSPVVSPPTREPDVGQFPVAAPTAPQRLAEVAPAQPAAASVSSAGPPAPSVPSTSTSDTPVAPATPAAAAQVAPSPTDAPLMLAFRDFSWTEVKDRQGRVLLSRMNRGGTTQAVAGAPPLDLVIGNAADVTLTWKGKRIDLAPHTRQNVARLTLP